MFFVNRQNRVTSVVPINAIEKPVLSKEKYGAINLITTL